MKINYWPKFAIALSIAFLAVICLNFPWPLQAAPATPAPLTLPPNQTSEIAEYKLPSSARLIDIHSVNPNIGLDIRYATTNNFVRRKLYPEARCILRASVAQKLSQVQNDLQQIGLGLKVFDCYRPLSVTKQMWEVASDRRFVANPAKGSRHNRGAAIDLTLVDRNGKELEMPTGYDDFTERAGRTYQGNDLSPKARQNSQLLEEVMKKYGFLPLPHEWWHFDSTDWQQFSILDIPFNQIPRSKRT